MVRKKQLPEYDITETITAIQNPELDIITNARKNIIAINKNNTETQLLELKEGRTKRDGHNRPNI